MLQHEVLSPLSRSQAAPLVPEANVRPAWDTESERFGGLRAGMVRMVRMGKDGKDKVGNKKGWLWNP